MKRNLVLTVALCAIAGMFTFQATAATEEKSAIYPATMVVTEVDAKNDLVTCSTATGIYYQFFGIEDYESGDLIGMIMDDNGTPENILDDKIVSSRYTGATKFFDELTK